MSIDPTSEQEKYRITVTGANGSGFYVKFINPLYDPNNKRSVQIWTSDLISDNASSGTMRSRIIRYYWSIWGSNIDVEKISYDADDVETSDSDLVVKTIYTVTVVK